MGFLLGKQRATGSFLSPLEPAPGPHSHTAGLNRPGARARGNGHALECPPSVDNEEESGSSAAAGMVISSQTSAEKNTSQ